VKKVSKPAEPKWPNNKKPAKKAETKKTPKKAPPKKAEPKKNKSTSAINYVTRKIRVVIDAGHGRHDSGAVGPKGTKEKDVVLKIAKKLEKLINKNSKMTAIMTRKSDKFVKLYDRVSKARKEKGDLFISIHANAVPKSSAKNQAGAMVFILNRRGATSKLAKYLEQSENNSGKIGGQDIIKVDKDVRDLVYGMVQGAVIDESRILASHIIKQMKKANNVFKYSIEGANFAVLSAPDIPSVLVETTFISTPKEERRLKSNAYQDKLAKAIYDGVVGFTQQRSHIGREAK
jgi:N-acetylmuramoyl-L-alanine amidase